MGNTSGPPINEIVNLLHTFAPSTLAGLVSMHPAHDGVLDPGIIAGDSAPQMRMRVDVCVAGLEFMVELVPSLTRRFQKRQSRFGRLTWISLAAAIVANLVSIALAGDGASAGIRHGTAAASLAFVVLVACIQGSGIIQRDLEGLRRTLRIKEMARHTCVELRCLRDVASAEVQVALLIAQGNQLADDIRELALAARLDQSDLPRRTEICASSREALFRLFTLLFVSADDLRRWIWLGSDGTHLINAIAVNSSLEQCAGEAVRVLEAWGYVDGDLFDRLLRSFPRQAGSIHDAARLWGYLPGA